MHIDDSAERKALLLHIRALERFYQEQWERAIVLLNRAPRPKEK